MMISTSAVVLRLMLWMAAGWISNLRGFFLAGCCLSIC